VTSKTVDDLFNPTVCVWKISLENVKDFHLIIRHRQSRCITNSINIVTILLR
jgi:hypothetical protein